MDAKRGEGIFVLFVIVLVALGGLLRAFAWNQIKGLLARGWMTVQARVELGGVTAHRTRYKDFYVGRVDYSYSYNNEYYSGYVERTFVLERSADPFVDGMKGQMV